MVLSKSGIQREHCSERAVQVDFMAERLDQEERTVDGAEKTPFDGRNARPARHVSLGRGGIRRDRDEHWVSLPFVGRAVAHMGRRAGSPTLCDPALAQGK